MKSVLISIKPKWVELIANGKKTVEVRKTKPKIDVPFKCYIYQTKAKDKLVEVMKDGDSLYGETYHGEPVFIKTFGKHHWDKGNGKVMGEFVCDGIDEIGYSPEMHGQYVSNIENLHEVSCVDFEEMFDYIADGFGYGWHISNLVIYDKPKELSGFYHYCGDNPKCDGCEAHYFSNTECGKEDYCCSIIDGCKPITRPPQSWQFVEEIEI